MTDSVHAFFTNLQKSAQSERWADVVIDHPHRRLTKQDIFDYYSDPKVRYEIVRELKKGPAMLIQSFHPEKSVLKRNDAGAPIHIAQDTGEVENPRDYQYWIERRMTEFHPTTGPVTDRVWVDLDPTEGFGWDRTKETTDKVADLIDRLPQVNDTHLRYSGNRGFYVIGNLIEPMPTDDARRLTNKVLEHLTVDPTITQGIPRPGQLRLDTSTLRNKGSIRGALSLHSKTGLVSMPLEQESLDDFTPEDAEIRSVLGGRPARARPFRL